jgi:riboflavin synthase
MVQGHVDTTAICLDSQNQEGSWVFRFGFPNLSVT